MFKFFIFINKPKPVIKYDENYEKEFLALFVGFLLLLYNIADLLKLIEIKVEYRNIVIAFFAFVRIAVLFWVISIAKNQNRNKTVWGIFAFILPQFTLIAIGLTKKIMLEPPIDSKSNFSHAESNLYESRIKINNEAYTEWREKNPKKSLNDYYLEITKSKNQS